MSSDSARVLEDLLVVAQGRQALPLHTDEKRLYKHLLIVGQSGCGKSFFIGRLLEELVLHTDARVIVLDVNDDHSASHLLGQNTAGQDVWSDPNKKETLVTTDTKDSFRTAWADALTGQLTYFRHLEKASEGAVRDDGARGEQLVAAVRGRISIGLSRLNVREFRSLLGIDVAAHPEAVWLADELHAAGARWTGNAECGWPKVAGRLTKWASGQIEKDDGRFGVVPQAVSVRASVPAAVRVRQALEEALAFGIWNDDDGESEFERLGAADGGPVGRDAGRIKSLPRLVCVDLASIKERRAQLAAARYVLQQLWDRAHADRQIRASTGDAKESRPAFVFIDEAHNLASPDPEGPLAWDVLRLVKRIAAEGRKEGLFLVLGTQRPGKLHPDIVSECDNLGLMKLVDSNDLQMLKGRFSFVPDQCWSRVPTLANGEAILLGRWTGERSPDVVKTCARRTAERGADLPADAIGKVPPKS